MANLAVTGVLVLTVAAGLRPAAAHGEVGRWTARGLAVLGAGMLTAALFRADPSLGFPAGTPADYRAVSWHGIAHLLAASTGFAGAVVAILSDARRLSAAGRRGPATVSRAVAGFFVVSFLGLAATGSRVGVVAFTVGVVALFAWVAGLTVRCRPDA